MSLLEAIAKVALLIVGVASGTTALYKLIIEPIRIANSAYKEILVLRESLFSAQKKIEDILNSKTTQFEEMVELREQHALLKAKHDDLQRTLNRSEATSIKQSRRIEQVSEESKTVKTLYERVLQEYTTVQTLVKEKQTQLDNARVIFRSQGLTEYQIDALLEGSLQWITVRPFVLEFLMKHGTKQLNHDMLKGE